jgi:hypothetical protein
VKKEDTEQLMGFLRAAFPRMEVEQQVLYARLLEKELDVRLVTRAILKGIGEWRYPPSWAELRDYIKVEKRLSEPDTYRTPDLPKQSKMPPWVKQWICARFLFSHFDRERDDRVFAEQEYFSGPGEPMPEGEWATEGEHIKEGEAWHALRVATGVVEEIP